MTPRPDHIDDLIAGYLLGEATPDQIEQVERWRAESDGNRKYFDQVRLILDTAASSRGSAQFDTDRAWQNVLSKLANKDRREARTVSLARDYKLWMRIAAGILIVLAIGVFTTDFFSPERHQSLELLADRQTEADTLPDGSGVYLNRQTKIEYSFDEDKNMHVAKLAGEAYFNIHHDDDKTFIVEAEGTFIKDIGTSFNVKAYPGTRTIEVMVEEGEVWFYTEGNPGIYLKANGQGTYNKDTGTFTVGEPDANITSYKTRFFSFSNHTLHTVVETLNGVYEQKIRIDDNLKRCKLTVSFNNEDPDEIASIIAETLQLTVSRSGNEIILKGPGCGEPAP